MLVAKMVGKKPVKLPNGNWLSPPPTCILYKANAAAGIKTTTAGFIMPAVNGRVSIAVASTARMAAGQNYFIQNAGYMQVVSVTDATDVVMMNLGCACNASPSTAIGALWSAIGSPTTSQLNGVWGSGPNDIYVVGQPSSDSGKPTVLHWNGSVWATLDMEADWNPLCAVWGSGPNDVYIVGDNGWITHFDGSAWTRVQLPWNSWLRGVWGSSASDVWVTGDGEICRNQGSGWVQVQGGLNGAIYVWGSGPNNVFFVGGGGAIYHFDGSTLSPMTSNTTADLYAVWGSGPNDVYAVGAGGVILHYDGTAWSAISEVPPSGDLYGVGGNSASDVYAVGAGGTILHFDGNSWTAMASGATDRLSAVWGSSAADVFAVGNNGAILKHSASPLAVKSTGAIYTLTPGSNWTQVTGTNYFIITLSPAALSAVGPLLVVFTDNNLPPTQLAAFPFEVVGATADQLADENVQLEYFYAVQDIPQRNCVAGKLSYLKKTVKLATDTDFSNGVVSYVYFFYDEFSMDGKAIKASSCNPYGC